MIAEHFVQSSRRTAGARLRARGCSPRVEGVVRLIITTFEEVPKDFLSVDS
jgi:hypothetical protein